MKLITDEFYSTSIAWRPLYCPHEEHTMCGTLITPQLGHVDFGDALSVHALATRLRVADCGDFLFGTGMISLFIKTIN